MTYQLEPFAAIPLTEPLLETLLEEHTAVTLPRLERLWNYYRNALAEPRVDGGSAGPPAQRVGLPGRLHASLGTAAKIRNTDDRYQREVVIENDIGWRIHTLVDFMFPHPPRVVSKAADPQRRVIIETLLQAVIEANDGQGLWQTAALLGSVYGSVDFLVDAGGLSRARRLHLPHVAEAPASDQFSERELQSAVSAAAESIARRINIDVVEAPRAIALINRGDYRKLDAMILRYQQQSHEVKRQTLLARLSRRIAGRPRVDHHRGTIDVIEIYTAGHMQRYEDGVLVAESVNRLGRVPVVHIQNLPQPLHWDGLSDVEPLIPLQDELNTRLSDRANRVTMQSFRMWLGKGIEGFTDRPIGPGQMWVTDNLDASIEPFGGDADSPSEDAHLRELREALDKASGVTPAAAGHIQARIGNLTSENALRISLMGTIAKTKRKRVTYGGGIEQLCELILHALDVHDLFRTTPAERRVEVAWADPLPPDETRRINDALAKAQLGVPLETLREELGY